MKEDIQKKLNTCYEDLGVFHSNTFDISIDPTGEQTDIEVGKQIDREIANYNMNKKEDACYIAGQIDAYNRILDYLHLMKETHIPLTENDIQMLQEGEEHHWNYNDIDIHLFKED